MPAKSSRPKQAKSLKPDMSSYSDVTKLDPRGHVRLRPGMYIGGTDQRALHGMVFEVLDPPVEDAMLGACTEIEVILKPQHEISIRSNSVTFPLDVADNSNKRFLERVLTEAGIWKNYDKPGSYKITGGLHGVGVFVVNALSKTLTATVAQDGYLWQQSYHEGLPTSDVEQVRPLMADEPSGNTITFQPDFTIFEQNDFDFESICERCKEIAYQVKGLTLTVRDERGETAKEAAFHYAEGLAALIQQVNVLETPLHDPFYVHSVVSTPKYPDSPFHVSYAFQFTKGSATHEFGYVNTVATPNGGTHVTAFRAALMSFINDANRHYQRRQLSWDDIAPGLTYAISIRHPQPSYAGNAKYELTNRDI